MHSGGVDFKNLISTESGKLGVGLQSLLSFWGDACDYYHKLPQVIEPEGQNKQSPQKGSKKRKLAPVAVELDCCAGRLKSSKCVAKRAQHVGVGSVENNSGSFYR